MLDRGALPVNPINQGDGRHGQVWRGDGLGPVDLFGGRYSFEKRPYSVNGGVAVIPLSGVIAKRIFWMDAVCGDFADIAVFDSMLVHAWKDEEVKAIVVDADSPGGYGVGLPESRPLIRDIDRYKPVYVFTDTEMCSAAYWIGAGAREIAVSESSVIGSVGSYMFILDQTEQLAAEGIKVEALVSGKFKAKGHPWVSLTDEQREHLKGEHDDGFGFLGGLLLHVRRGSRSRSLHTRYRAVVCRREPMNLDTLQSFLGWCLVINLVVYSIWAIAMVCMREWLVKLQSRWFAIEPDQLRPILFKLLGQYKIALIVLNFVPWLSVFIINR